MTKSWQLLRSQMITWLLLSYGLSTLLMLLKYWCCFIAKSYLMPMFKHTSLTWDIPFCSSSHPLDARRQLAEGIAWGAGGENVWANGENWDQISKHQDRSPSWEIWTKRSVSLVGRIWLCLVQFGRENPLTFQHFAKAASEGVVPAGLFALSGLSLIMNSRSMLGVPLGRRYEGCWKALCLFTEAQEQILCTFQGRSKPGWLRLPPMLQSYLMIHSHCLQKCSLNLLYANPLVSPPSLHQNSLSTS